MADAGAAAVQPQAPAAEPQALSHLADQARSRGDTLAVRAFQDIGAKVGQDFSRLPEAEFNKLAAAAQLRDVWTKLPRNVQQQIIAELERRNKAA